MDKDKAIQLLIKYKKISTAWDLKKDEEVFNAIIEFIENGLAEKPAPKAKMGPTEFNEFMVTASQGDADFSRFKINPEILSNRNQIVNFWKALDSDSRKKCSIFEINVIFFFISEVYNSYQDKVKKHLLKELDHLVASQDKEKAYGHIVV